VVSLASPGARSEALLPRVAAERRRPYQLLLRFQGPRGPTAIDCPVTTPIDCLFPAAVAPGRSPTVGLAGFRSLFLKGASALDSDGF
jgi:hypothetical protein